MHHRAGFDLAGEGRFAGVAEEGAVAGVAIFLGDAILVAVAAAGVLTGDALAGLAGIVLGAGVAIAAGIAVGGDVLAALLGGLADVLGARLAVVAVDRGVQRQTNAFATGARVLVGALVAVIADTHLGRLVLATGLRVAAVGGARVVVVAVDGFAQAALLVADLVGGAEIGVIAGRAHLVAVQALAILDAALADNALVAAVAGLRRASDAGAIFAGVGRGAGVVVGVAGSAAGGGENAALGVVAGIGGAGVAVVAGLVGARLAEAVLADIAFGADGVVGIAGGAAIGLVIAAAITLALVDRAGIRVVAGGLVRLAVTVVVQRVADLGGWRGRVARGQTATFRRAGGAFRQAASLADALAAAGLLIETDGRQLLLDRRRRADAEIALGQHALLGIAAFDVQGVLADVSAGAVCGGGTACAAESAGIAAVDAGVLLAAEPLACLVVIAGVADAGPAGYADVHGGAALALGLDALLSLGAALAAKGRAEFLTRHIHALLGIAGLRTVTWASGAAGADRAGVGRTRIFGRGRIIFGVCGCRAGILRHNGVCGDAGVVIDLAGVRIDVAGVDCAFAFGRDVVTAAGEQEDGETSQRRDDAGTRFPRCHDHSPSPPIGRPRCKRRNNTPRQLGQDRRHFARVGRRNQVTRDKPLSDCAVGRICWNGGLLAGWRRGL